jgi:predicted nucleic acid-binding protein
MRVYVDATTLISLGNVGRLNLLKNLDADIAVLPAVRDEVTTEPARTNVEDFLQSEDVHAEVSEYEDYIERSVEILREEEVNGDVEIVAAVLAHDTVAVVSDDRRVRTVSEGFGATVSGTVGVVVRAVRESTSVKEGKGIIQKLDRHGLHMTAEIREKAYDLLEEAGNRSLSDSSNG